MIANIALIATHLQIFLRSCYDGTMKSSGTLTIIIAAVLIIGVLAGVLLSTSAHKTSSNGTKLNVVAAENFWGSLVSQIGGDRVNVTSIVSDPNADPHEYESNAADARDIAVANYVILNGAGYDSWGNKLLSASPNANRKVLTVATLLGKKDGDNPHFWYNPSYVNTVTVQMEHDLASLAPADSSYFAAQLKTLQASLSGYQNRIAEIKKQYGGINVAATEDIFAYLAQAAGLNLISPPAFIEAVAEGNDPPTASVAQFQQQLESGQVKVLVYNEQTVTPLTNTIKVIAAQQNIPIVGVTETIQPPDTSFQDWMNSELLNLENALNARQLGQ
jgi:zinc/manganese transport system substrate-binding protein